MPTFRELPFVDAHVHFWDLDAISYPWLTPPFSSDGVNGDVSPIAQTYLPSHYDHDAEGWNVVGMVHVEAGADPQAADAETAWLETVAQSEPRLGALVAAAPLHSRDLEQRLEKQASFPTVRAIRHIANYHTDPKRTYTPEDVIANPGWQAGYAHLAKYGLGFDLQAYPSQFPAFARLASAHPDIPVVINHLGMGFPDERDLWKAGMERLSQLPHVSVKISGFGLTDRNWTMETVRPLILETIELFGTDRVMVASDFPTDKLHASLNRCLSTYADILRSFSDDEARDLWGRNAARIYRIDGLRL